jgi:putative ABC transport system permease protein
VLGLVFRSPLRLLTFGVAFGIAVAWAGSWLIASMLFGLTASNPPTIVAAIVLLGMTAFIAAFLPALRASRVDPMGVLRYE